MNETEYRRLADNAFERIEKVTNDLDPDVIEVERRPGVISIVMQQTGKKITCILSTQVATRQIWLAISATASAIKFSYDEERKAWVDDKEVKTELFSFLSQQISQYTSLNLEFY